MRWARAWLFAFLTLIAIFILMFYSRAFMHGDP